MISVLIAEDMHLIRSALVALLALEPDIDVVADLSRGDRVLESALRVRPDVAVLDLDLPGSDGLAVAAGLHARVPQCRSLVLADPCRPARLLRALQVPVCGLIVKNATVATLTDAIRKVAAGQRVIDPELMAAALATGASPLTSRETDVLRAAQSGFSTKDIGASLALSPTTVRNYLSNAIGKIGARNRLDAIRIACDAGWL